jgi:solute carrier family 45 protein 1/2/4
MDTENLKEIASHYMRRMKERLQVRDADQADFENVQRKKSRLELITISLVVCGIEFCYAAETAFVTPLLLKIGLPVQYMTMVWCLSPLFGFFACPILGSLSDRCNSRLGRRRPFIILYSIGIVFGLIFVSYGRFIGTSIENSLQVGRGSDAEAMRLHPFVIIVTIIGVFMLDFNCDACQSPSRAYLVDVTAAEDHPVGLSTFTIMAGAGGFFGYLIGAVPWEDFFKASDELTETFVNETLSLNEANETSHVQIIFTVVLFIFVACAVMTLTSFKEIRMMDFHALTMRSEREQLIRVGANGNAKGVRRYGEPDDEVSEDGRSVSSMNFSESGAAMANDESMDDLRLMDANSFRQSFVEYFRILVSVPSDILVLCLTNFFCWMSLVCYSLYFTDFVAQEIFGNLKKQNVSILSLFFDIFNFVKV